MWVIVEENYAGLYVVGKPGDEDVYDDLDEARAKLDEYEQTAEEAGQPCGYEVYVLWPAPAAGARAAATPLVEARKILEYALHLRMYGERAPGGNETWGQFDRRCETFLRATDPCPEPEQETPR